MKVKTKVICSVCLAIFIVAIVVVFAVIKINDSKNFEKVNLSSGSIEQIKEYKLYEFGIENNTWSEDMDKIVQEVAEYYADILDFEYIDVTKNMTFSNFYAVDTFPTYIITDRDGNVKYRTTGIMTEDEFIAFVEQVIE